MAGSVAAASALRYPRAVTTRGGVLPSRYARIDSVAWPKKIP